MSVTRLSSVNAAPNQRFGEVFRLVTQAYGFPMPPTNALDTAQRVQRNFNPELPSGSKEAQPLYFRDPAGFPIMMVNADAEAYRKATASLELAEKGRDPYIGSQAKMAERLLMKNLSDQAANLDVTQVEQNPGQFPIDRLSDFSGASASLPATSPTAVDAARQAINLAGPALPASSAPPAQQTQLSAPSAPLDLNTLLGSPSSAPASGANAANLQLGAPDSSTGPMAPPPTEAMMPNMAAMLGQAPQQAAFQPMSTPPASYQAAAYPSAFPPAGSQLSLSA
jgi:hypothetical protein